MSTASTVEEIVKLVDEAAAAFETLAPGLGAADVVPLVESARKLMDAVAALVDGDPTAQAKAEVAGADTVADAAEDAKFGVK